MRVLLEGGDIPLQYEAIFIKPCLVDPRRRAFTLIELLSVIAIIAVLAALAFAGLARARVSADKMTAATSMRQIGSSLGQFCGDNDGYLPGPLKVGQGSLYDPAQPDQLATKLGPYLGVTHLENPGVVDVFLPPAYLREMRNSVKPEDARPFLLKIDAHLEDGNRIFPWGDDKAGKTPPMPIAMVPGEVWAITDADQEIAEVKKQPWAGKTPKRIVHGSQRLALYFDGSARSISQAALDETPPSAPPPPGGGVPPPGGGPKPPPPPK